VFIIENEIVPMSLKRVVILPFYPLFTSDISFMPLETYLTFTMISIQHIQSKGGPQGCHGIDEQNKI
jgi:hypothetical protein